jgi:hypothetical protein
MIAADILGFIERITQQIISAIIEDINRYCSSSSLYFSIQEKQVTFWNL